MHGDDTAVRAGRDRSADAAVHGAEPTMRHAQGALDLEEVRGQRFVARAVQVLGDAGDPGHELIERGHCTGEHCSLVVHRPSLPEPLRSESGQIGR